MIQLINRDLAPKAKGWLGKWQNIIDSKPTYKEQKEEARRLWPQKSTTNTLAAVKDTLELMCSGAKRCQYCEDSAACAVDHFEPKAIFPEKTFAWSNHIYSCQNCNIPKANKFEVYAQHTGNRINVSHLHHTQQNKDTVLQRPTKGNSVLINPRYENPMMFLELDLKMKSFHFTEREQEGTIAYERAFYTIETLELNKRDYLVDAREAAYENYLSLLQRYVNLKTSAATKAELNRPILAIKKGSHVTVWKEMIRQHLNIQELKVLFEKAPEALNW